jgi:hypothetical protein
MNQNCENPISISLQNHVSPRLQNNHVSRCNKIANQNDYYLLVKIYVNFHHPLNQDWSFFQKLYWFDIFLQSKFFKAIMMAAGSKFFKKKGNIEKIGFVFVGTN